MNFKLKRQNTFLIILNVQFVFAFQLASLLLEMFDDQPPIIYNLIKLKIRIIFLMNQFISFTFY
jgi:hypothetical protein